MVGEWFLVNKSFREFLDSGGVSPGILFEAIISGRKKQFLVGDINPNGSMSIGGKPLTYDTIISRYRIIWSR
jgi:hypothetical protein